MRFENLSPDSTPAWMGRGFSEVIAAELANAPGMYVIPSARMHALDQGSGARPISAPGISAERALALSAGANRIGYGEYWVVRGQLQARLTIEDPNTGKIVRVLSTSVPNGDVISAASALARQLSTHTSPYGTKSIEALQAYTQALEAAETGTLVWNLEQAIAADPGFGAPYVLLAEAKARTNDPNGAAAVIQAARARGNALPPADRARIESAAAALNRDAAGAQRALAELTANAPHDPGAWRSLAETAFNRHDYRTAATAYQSLLGIEPENLSGWNQLGYALAYAGDLDGAVSALRRYQTIRPGDANPLDSMGDVNLLHGRLREAEAFYLEAARKDPKFLESGDLMKAAMARLMTGDIAGADSLARKYAETRAAAHDPLVEYRKAEWSWTVGRRREACSQLEVVAAASEPGPARELAARAWAELALWKVMLGDRTGAADATRRAASLAGASTSGLVAVARFLLEPPASVEEWTARADRYFGNNPVRDFALSYALLMNRKFEAASVLLKRLTDSTGPVSDANPGILLAWALTESGRPGEAVPLLRLNPIPLPGGPGLFAPFYFPRLFYLRAVTAAVQGRRDESGAMYRLFVQLSGPEPLIWGEEQKARAAQ